MAKQRRKPTLKDIVLNPLEIVRLSEREKRNLIEVSYIPNKKRRNNKSID